jgi:radical SAM protein with 4Fe4S-binding SPASM domain
MWWHHDLGSVRERPFSQIWQDTSDPLMVGLKQHPRPVQGRCARCRHLAMCGGNTRTRAQQLTGNPWAEDPGCYLTDAEIGLPAPPSAADAVTAAGARPAVVIPLFSTETISNRTYANKDARAAAPQGKNVLPEPFLRKS